MNEEITITPKEQTMDVTVEKTESEPLISQYQPVAELFGIDNPNESDKQKLTDIYEYFADKDMSPKDIKWAVYERENRYQTPIKMGESRLDKMYEYITLRKEASKVEERLKQL